MFDRAYLRTQYERLDEFAAMTLRYDPVQRLRNKWVDAMLTEP